MSEQAEINNCENCVFHSLSLQEMPCSKCNDDDDLWMGAKDVIALQSALTTAQEENKYLKTWIPEYLDDRLSRGEQTEIREFIRGKIDLDKLPQWLVNIVEENKRYRLALEKAHEASAMFPTGNVVFDKKMMDDVYNAVQSALNGGK